MTEEVVKTQEELQVEIKSAVDAGDWAQVKRISGEIAKLVKSEEKTERDAKLAAVAELTETVKSEFEKLVTKLLDKYGDMVSCDGVWFSKDFGDQSSSCRLLKSQPKARTGGGGGAGKKFSVTTKELLDRYGDQPNGETGVSLKDAYEATTDGNKRYNIRVKLLKLANIS